MFRHPLERWRSTRRAPAAWVLAWLALALNAIAPVIAYASLSARHQHQQTIASPPAPVEYSGSGHHEAGHHGAGHHDPSHHAHHADNPAATGVDPSQPTAPHCQYCPDFAAGAPLSISVANSVDRTPLPSVAPFHFEASFHAKPHFRLAWARGPPLQSA